MANYDAALNNGAVFRFNVVQTSQSVPNNTSTDAWSLELLRGSNTSSWTAGPVYWTVTINGQTWSGSFGFDFINNASIVIASGTTNPIGHNADGTKNTSIFANMGGTGTSVGGPATINTTFAQTTIPRASTSTVEIANSGGPTITTADAGVVVDIRTNRASSGFTHTLDYSIGSSGWLTIDSGVGALYEDWTLPMSALNQIPNALSGTLNIRTKTYSGATLIGEKTTVFILKVPTSVVPDMTTITHAEAVSAVSTIMGGTQNYVQSQSKMALAITGAVGAYGSTIVSYKIEVAGQTINAVSGTTPSVISTSGTVPIVGTVTDSRGRTYSENVNATVLAYVPPSIDNSPTELIIQRADSGGVPTVNGTYIRVDLKAAVQSLLVSAVQKNTLKYEIDTSPRGANTWTNKISTTLAVGTVTFNTTPGGSAPTVGTAYDIEESWDVRVKVIDKFNTANPTTVIATVSTAAILMHWSKDLSGNPAVGIGKFNEQGTLDVSGQIYQNNGLSVIDTGDAATTSVKGIVELATSAESITGTDTTRAVTPSGLRAVLDDEIPENPLLNSDFSIWQRGTSFTGFASSAYTADRWMCRYNGTGATRTVSRQAFTPGTAPVAGYEGEFFYRYAQTVAGTGMTLLYFAEQRIEDVRCMAGKTVTVSFWAKADSARNLVVNLTQDFGTGGSASASISASSVAVTTSWARYTVTIALASMSGKTIGTDSFLALSFRSSNFNATQTWDIWGVQVEPGTTAGAFRRQNPAIGVELAACQRYCRRITADSASYKMLVGMMVNGTIAYLTWQYPEMRIGPTFSASGTFQIDRPGVVAPAATSLPTGGPGTPTLIILATTTTSSTTAISAQLLAASGAYLDLSAEL